MKILAIYYIATSVYKELFPEFLENVPKLFPSFHKKVVVISDGLQEYDGISGPSYKVQVFSDIEHRPWPYIALHKMDIIKDHRVECDYACYMNANLILNPEFNKDIDHMFLYSRMNFTRHCYLLKEDVQDGQYFQGKVNQISKDDLQLVSSDIRSSSYIADDYQYCQSGFFLGPEKLFFKFCEDVSELRKIDEARNIIPTWHDEAYLNAWIYRYHHLNLTKLPIKRLMIISAVVGKYDFSNIPFIIKRDVKKVRN